MKTIKIKGMTCNHCVMAVTRALEKIDENTYGICDVSGEEIPLPYCDSK